MLSRRNDKHFPSMPSECLVASHCLCACAFIRAGPRASPCRSLAALKECHLIKSSLSQTVLLLSSNMHVNYVWGLFNNSIQSCMCYFVFMLFISCMFCQTVTSQQTHLISPLEISYPIRMHKSAYKTTFYANNFYTTALKYVE